MAIALDPNRTWDYILEADRELPKSGQTTFHLRSLTPSELAEVNDLGFMHQVQGGKRTGEVRATPAAQVLRTLQCGLTGWTNLLDSKGKQVKAPADVDDRIAMIDEEARIELAREIRFGGQVTVEEGNS